MDEVFTSLENLMIMKEIKEFAIIFLEYVLKQHPKTI